MASVVSYVAALVGVIGAVLLALPGTRTTSQHRYGVVGLLLLAGTVASAAPATLRLSVRVEPIPNLVRDLNAAMAMFGLYCVVAILIHSTRSPGAASRLARRHFAILACWVILAIACLYLSRAQLNVMRIPAGANFWLRAYFSLLLLYDGAALIAFIALSCRMIRLPESTQLVRLGFRVAMIAGLIAFVHNMWAIAVTLRIRHLLIDQNVSALLLSTALTFLAVGLTAPVWGTWPSSLITRLSERRLNRALQDLWWDLAELHAAVGTASLVSVPASFQRQAVSPLHRSWLALRDLQVAARPYIYPAVRSWAADAAQRHGLSPAATSTIVEAAELGTALDAVRSGARPRLPDPANGRTGSERRKEERRSADTPLFDETTVDLHGEARHLRQIGFALRYSPLVARMRHMARSERDGTMALPSTSIDAVR